MGDTLRIADDAGTSILVLTSATPATDPLLITAVDFGYPEVREVAEDWPDADGVRDSTRFTGARAVTFEGVAQGDGAGTPAAYLARLRGLCHPARRVYLHAYQDEWGEERRVLIRGDSVASPEANPRRFTTGWKAPLGVLETVTADTVTIRPVAAETGLSAPTILPASFGNGGTPAQATIVNSGTLDAWPTIDVFGQCSAIELNNLTTGKSFRLAVDAEVAVGAFWRIDMRNHSVLVNNDPAITRYSSVDFGNSEWWSLAPGTNVILFHASQSGVSYSCAATLTWRKTWL